MAEFKSSSVLQETKFIVVDEGSKAMYADLFVAGYVQMMKAAYGNTQLQVHLLLFIGPDCFPNYLSEIIEKDNLKIYDYFSPDIQDLSKNPEINLDYILTNNDFGLESVVVINCLSSLILTVGLAKATRFVVKLASRVGHLICIFNRDICVEKFPNIETLGTTYVQLNRYDLSSITLMLCQNEIEYEISMTHRNRGGRIWKSTLVAKQNFNTYEIEFDGLSADISNSKISSSKSTLKPEVTFRTELNARELEQRNKTPLPYTLNSNLSNESKILYVPDDVDDFDEEDPDDDLPF